MNILHIHERIINRHGIEMSAEMVQKNADNILPRGKERQSMNSVYPFVFMDCLRYWVHYM